ncbi:hypothetical protein SUGI_0433620 [Cryptomeria japonica]|nr:hypothetical protein SUGI_0433620 [Cryptomeria japonica]
MDPELYKAAKKGLMDALDKFSSYAILVGVSPEKNTALHIAASNGHVDYILSIVPMKQHFNRLTFRRPGIVKIGDEYGRTALHIAALIPALLPISQMKLKKICQIGAIILKNDGELCCKVDKIGQSALHTAAKEGNEYLVEKILQHNNLCIEMVDNDGRNDLHLAVMTASKIFYRAGYSLKTIISSVMEKKLVDCADKEGHTALDLAIQKDRGRSTTICWGE